MKNNFDIFYENYKNKLKKYETNSEVNNFISGLQNLYPLATKLFIIDSEKAINDNINLEKFNVLNKHVFENVLPNIENYNVLFNKVTLTENGETKEYPLTNPVHFVNKYLSITEETPYYYLLLSYVIVPKNYDIIQLCDK